MDLPAAFVVHHARIQQEMRAVLEGRTLPIYDMVRYALGWQESDGTPREGGGGKGMRPSLTLLSAETLAGAAGRERAAGGAAAVEMVHAFSLVHDDIQDEDRERHHRETVWVVWGRAQAINVGDALRELAEHALRRSAEAGASAEAVLAGTTLLNQAALEMIEGQYLDLSFEERTNVGVNAYLAMIGRKTGAMLGCSMGMGALLATEDAKKVAALDRAGRRLGLCFQISDDWLGLWGDSAATGKSTDNDIRRRKKSYPIVFAFENASGSTRATLEAIYAKESMSDGDVEEVMGILTSLRASEATKLAAKEHHDGFLEELSALDLDSAGQASFDEIANFILHRDL